MRLKANPQIEKNKIKMEEIRKEIDQIDTQLCELYEKRMNLVQKIAAVKKEKQLPIYDKKREAVVIEKSLNQLHNHEFDEGYQIFLKCLLAQSKAVQEKWLSENQ